jgi:hypothetical protein
MTDKKPDWWGHLHDQAVDSAIAKATNNFQPALIISRQPYIISDLVRTGILDVEENRKTGVKKYRVSVDFFNSNGSKNYVI